MFFGLLNNYYGQGFFGNPKVNHHLKKIFDVYGTMLRSHKSQHVLNKQTGWLSEKAQTLVYYPDFIHEPNDPYFGYETWNDWFVRRLKPDARKIDPSPKRIVNSSDSYCLPSPVQPVRDVKAQNSFWLKDDNYSLYDMFGVAKMGPEIKQIVDESFVGGTVYQAFLSPWCYHRWHAPYSGKLIQTYKLPGTYLLENPTSNPESSGVENYVNTQPMLTSLSVRHVYIIDTLNPSIGKIGLIEIGMGEVSSCISTVNRDDIL
jgi:phosphatidylserine decarboxylase